MTATTSLFVIDRFPEGPDAPSPMARSEDAEKEMREGLERALRDPRDEVGKFQGVLTQLFDAYEDDVSNHARRRVSEAHVDDVSAATWDAVPRALESFKGESSFRSWLLRIATNKATDVLRRARDRDREALSNVISSLFAQAPSRERPSREVARAEMDHLVRRLIDELTPDDRELLLLHYREGKKAVDIARERGLAPNAYSGLTRSPIPIRPDHRFRSDPITRSGGPDR